MTDILLAADDKYLPFYLVTLVGIATHAESCGSIAAVVPASISRVAVERFRRGAKAIGFEPEIVPLSAVERLRATGLVDARGHVSAFTYAKLFMPEVLSDVDDALYLDADTLIRGELGSLISLDLHHPVGAVRELGDNGKALFGRTDIPYFNAGVLRLSLSRLRKERVADSAIQFLRSNSSLHFQDQDVWNWMFRDRHDALPLTFNFFDPLARHALPSWELLDDPKIVHFVGPSKPWHSDCHSRFGRQWRRVHAEILGYTGAQRDDYIRGGVNSWQELVHDSVVRFRHSRPGSAIRGRLPLGAKRTLNDLVASVVPRRTRFRNDWDHAIYCEVPQLLSEASLPSIPEQTDLTSRSSSLVVEVNGRDAQPQSLLTGGHLLLILSSRRSGTNALMSILEGSLRSVRCEGELFGGFVNTDTRERLVAEWPEIRDHVGPLKSTAWAERQGEEAGRRAVFSSLAVPILSSLMAGREGVTLVKVFDDQLDRAVLQDLMAMFRPRVILLRRQILFSLVSLLKAEHSLSFQDSDSTQTPFSLTSDRILGYIRDTDEWFDWACSVIRELDIPHVDVTYADEVEVASQSQLRHFLSDWGYLADSGLGPPGPSTRRQDTRTDSVVTGLLEQVASLEVPLSDLLRLPGKASNSSFRESGSRIDIP